jgi:hypothetical protein
LWATCTVPQAPLSAGWRSSAACRRAINAVRPAVEYGVDLRKAAEFEQLYWDVFNHAIAELPTADAAEIPARLNGFPQRMQEFAITSGGLTATSS